MDGYDPIKSHFFLLTLITGRSLACIYQLTKAIKPSTRDWIGIFKVGWSSTRQYMAFDWAPIPENWDARKNSTQKIMLDGKDLIATM